MMKLRYLALSMALMMALALAGCSANRDNDHVESASPTHSLAPDNKDRASSGVDDGARYSDNAGNIQNSAPGGNDGPSASGGVMDDIGDAAGDLARGAGNVARGAGDAIGDAADNIGRAMR